MLGRVWFFLLSDGLFCLFSTGFFVVLSGAEA
uniref:Uncharacterized protein n=1 Tax=Podoviridae sp. ctz6O13 TaxID=2827757 RepID=A0A8S5TKN3_9CAUD|nr:MAG TPA: hypothetical protein [Podoviridae sp. ctz6O13]